MGSREMLPAWLCYRLVIFCTLVPSIVLPTVIPTDICICHVAHPVLKAPDPVCIKLHVKSFSSCLSRFFCIYLLPLLDSPIRGCHPHHGRTLLG